MTQLLTRGEIKAATTLGAEAVAHAELRDPWGWADLTGHPDATVHVVKHRIEVGRTPARAHVFRWPKEKAEYRPMAYLDPYDQIIFRGITGRLVDPIYATLDGDAVSSPRLVHGPPRWRLEHWGKANARRRDLARALLESHSCMGGFDVRNFFPTVRRAALEHAYGHLPLNAPAFELVLGWLDELDESYGVRGLPIGHEGSHALGNGLLASCGRGALEGRHPVRPLRRRHVAVPASPWGVRGDHRPLPRRPARSWPWPQRRQALLRRRLDGVRDHRQLGHQLPLREPRRPRRGRSRCGYRTVRHGDGRPGRAPLRTAPCAPALSPRPTTGTRSTCCAPTAGCCGSPRRTGPSTSVRCSTRSRRAARSATTGSSSRSAPPSRRTRRS